MSRAMSAAGDGPFRWDFVTHGLPDAVFADASSWKNLSFG